MAGLFVLGKAAAQREYPQRYFLAQPTPPNAKRTATHRGAVVWRTSLRRVQTPRVTASIFIP